MQAHGTVTDSLGASTSQTITVSAGGATGLRTVTSSMLSNRMNWGSVVDSSTNGPDPTPSDNIFGPPGPVTLGLSLNMLAPGSITGMRIFKMPLGNGTIIAAMWDSAGTLLASKSATWVSDEGGWRTILFDTKVPVSANQEYNWGYFYPTTGDVNYAFSNWVWNGQHTTVWPFWEKSFNETGAGARTDGAWRVAANGLTFAGQVTQYRTPSNYYIDPIIERTLDTPGYASGTSYYSQFTNGGSRFNFPVGVFFADPENLVRYKAAGVNTLFAGNVSDSYIAAITTADMDWYPSVDGGDLSAPIYVQEDSTIATKVRGYLLNDEPDLNTPWKSPADLRGFRNTVRRLDSTRPIYVNLSRYAAINQGFTWQPVGVNAVDKELNLREYMSLADIGSIDSYSIAGTDSFNFDGGAGNRYGIWTYPLIVKRTRAELSDQRIPVFGVVETTSSFAGLPTPTQVKQAVWASLIAGATGIMYFDHRFYSPQVNQDFAAALNDTAMRTAITTLNAQMQSLSGALLGAETNLITGYASSGTLAANVGGYAKGTRVPLHYTSRASGGTQYLFIQAIRPGTTTATVTVPVLANATLTVIGESRTVAVNGSGVFTDTFGSDYEYHLYSTTAAPSFTAPVNTVIPVLSIDGPLQAGAVITCSTGTWNGVPTPTFAYQWQRAGVDISGAVNPTYTVQSGDVGQTLRCRVTATNSQGSASVNSTSISPALFSDDFNRSNSAATGWTLSAGGAANVVSNALQLTGWSGYGRAYRSGLPKAASVKATFTGAVAADQGIFLAHTETVGSGIKLYYNGTSWVLGNSSTATANNTAALNVSGVTGPVTTVQLDFDGTNALAYLNNTLVATVSRATLGITLDTATGNVYEAGYCGQANTTSTVSVLSTQTPTNNFTAADDAQVYTLGMGFNIMSDGYSTTAGRYWKADTSYDGVQIQMGLWRHDTGVMVASANRVQLAGDAIGWVNIPWVTPYTLLANVNYTVGRLITGLGYTYTINGLATATSNPPFATGDRASRLAGAGPLGEPGGFFDNNYFIDVVASSGVGTKSNIDAFTVSAL